MHPAQLPGLQLLEESQDYIYVNELFNVNYNEV